MQKLGLEIIKEAKKMKIKELDKKLAESLAGATDREMIDCPICHYVTKKGKPSARVFLQEDGSREFKCFSCGIWRSL